ncbi:MAG: leucine--tRNA ligase [Candidatus Pacebacteria bacterium]|nr:leucine--tRNA ligase [Candidatus Paceibacterota bacterium]
MPYNHKKIDKKWQRIWGQKNTFKTQDFSKKPKFYILDMFPYPSGVGLHVGHPRGFVATDIYSRYKRIKGFNVLHPMGFDAFGLPAENYALKNKIHPEESVRKNIKRYREQLEIIGLDYDWSRTLSTTDPDYYKWTQWTFLQMFKKGLIYQSLEPINWCPKCKTGLANEDLEGDKCERCDTKIIKKPIKQWVIKITKYADRLLKDLEELNWPENIKELQRNWIGKSEGYVIEFKTNDKPVSVFTTRIDTLFGASYLAIAPEHELNKSSLIKNKKEVQKYVKKSLGKPDIERSQEKTGIQLKGIFANNPVNNEKIPVFTADYVLSYYGTGAVMAVPAHDQRDYEFSKKYNLKIKKVIKNDFQNKAFENFGILINSASFSGLESKKAQEKIAKLVKAEKKITYKLKDWVFSRQRYWGEPIPLIHCQKCGVVPEKNLPLKLPKVKSYQSTKTGESPLKNINSWVKIKCPNCQGPAERETNTMPQWAGSCWYYLRYIDNKNDKKLIDPRKERYWMPVDFYVGGAEHATRHLIYARFWHKFLYDIGIVSEKEPFLKLKSPGMISGTDGRKMSKRWGNVINPDQVIQEYGADAFRTYEMFMGPFNQETAWSDKAIKGIRRFLDKVYLLKEQKGKDIEKLFQKTIKKVTQDIEEFKFNTAVSALMILLNEMEKSRITKKNLKIFLILLHPFAPHLTCEIWEKKEFADNVFFQKWPEFKEIKEEKTKIIVQVNGKVRSLLEIDSGLEQIEVEKIALSKIEKWTTKERVKKIVFIKDKLINFVI